MTKNSPRTRNPEQSINDALSRIGALMFMLLGVFFVTILLLSQYQTTSAQKREAQLASSALTVRGKQIEDLAWDYSTWEDVFQKFVVERDYAWADENIGHWVFENNHFNVSAIITPDRETIYANVGGVRTDADLRTILKGGVDDLISKYRSGDSEKTASALLSDNGAPVVTAIAPITPTAELPEPRKDYYLLIFAQTLDASTLSEIGQTYLLPDLRMRSESLDNDVRNGTSIPLILANGKTLGHLTWDGATPGTTLLKTAIPIWAVLFTVFIVLMRYFAKTAKASAHRLRVSQYRATHDSLTGLGNRALLNDFFEPSDLSGKNTSDDTLCLLYLDLDGFKQINDVHGHQVGDDVLKEIGARLSTFAAENEVAVRLGGDEFILLLKSKFDPIKIAAIGQSIIESVERPISLGGADTVCVGATIGISLAPQDGDTPDILLKKADEALRHGKTRGKRQVIFYADIVLEMLRRERDRFAEQREAQTHSTSPTSMTG
ncbi:diguanylate cyclase [Fulvimarina sp. MAC3]|uniref:diguanylate cyclase domain-containing protein n=1 Tax=Fulvimarina sp. MAC3 TaxID=3148887 RepID=UPI0031FCFB8C